MIHRGHHVQAPRVESVQNAWVTFEEHGWLTLAKRPRLKLFYVSGVRVSDLRPPMVRWCDALAHPEGGLIPSSATGARRARSCSSTILLKPKVWQQLLSMKGTAA